MKVQNSTNPLRIVKDKPILFTGPMVRAILEGRKTQTRRVIRPQPPPEATFAGQYRASHQPYDGEFDWCAGDPKDVDTWTSLGSKSFRSPYGEPGDRLWVRESMGRWESGEKDAFGTDMGGEWFYVADETTVTVPSDDKERVNALRMWAHHKEQDYCPSIHMPRWASRLTLEITKVRVERVQDISEDDAIAEGTPAVIVPNSSDTGENAKTIYRRRWSWLWDSINARGNGGIYAWDKNPWVWVIEFRSLRQSKETP